jgi:MYXO-CTERM domain-containing protein
LITEQGWTFHLENRFANRDLNVGPAALRIETLREEGAPEVLTDNADLLKGKAGGCSVAGPESMLAALGLLALARRRRTVR